VLWNADTLALSVKFIHWWHWFRLVLATWSGCVFSVAQLMGVIAWRASFLFAQGLITGDKW